MSHIFASLYLGNLQDATEMTDVDLVVNCTPEFPFYAENSKKYRLPFIDDPQDQDKLFSILLDPRLFDDMVNYILNEKKILVHCHAGMSRSPTVVACFMMYYCKYVQKVDYNLNDIGVELLN